MLRQRQGSTTAAALPAPGSPPSPWLALITLLLLYPTLAAAAFTFTNTAPTQCDPLTVKWKGGQPPFRLLMIAPDRPMYNFTIPANASSNGAGSYTIPQLFLPQFQRVMFTMSDATGVATGGVTSLLTVGDTLSNAPCNTTSGSPDFVYSLDTDLEECKPYTFSLYPNAVQPVTIYGFIPNGASFALSPPVGDHFDWKNNLTAGTTVIFYMQDSLNRDGGISSVGVVRLSDDASCVSSTGDLNSTASASSSAPPTGTPTSDPLVASGSGSNIAVIAGAAAGGGAAVLLLGLLAGCCIWRRRRRRRSHGRLPMVTTRKGSSKETMDLLDGAEDANHFQDATLSHYVVEPFMLDASASASASTPSLSATATGSGTGAGGAPATLLAPMSHKEQMRLSIMNETASQRTTPTHSRRPSALELSEFGAGSEYLGVPSQAGGSSRFTTAQTSPSTYGQSLYTASRPSRDGLLSPHGAYSTVSGGGDLSPNARSSFSASTTAPRVIVHTDIAETQLMDDEEDQPLELPPMYSEGRTPIPGLLSSDIPSNNPPSTAPPADTPGRSRKGP